jgi:hypothetical protein
VVPPAEYQQVLAFWNGQGPRPSREVALRALFGLAENLRAERCSYNAEVVQALIPRSTAP